MSTRPSSIVTITWFCRAWLRAKVVVDMLTAGLKISPLLVSTGPGVSPPEIATRPSARVAAAAR
jgi:hypothetical protein